MTLEVRILVSFGEEGLEMYGLRRDRDAGTYQYSTSRSQ